MSLYQFLASDSPLKDVQNPNIEIISLNEMAKRNLVVPEILLNNKNTDPNEKIVLICESEELLHEIEIRKDNPKGYAHPYTSKKYVSEITFRYTDIRAEQLIKYISENLLISDELEIWSIWLDDLKEGIIETKSQNDLTLEDLKKVLGPGYYEMPRCLKIKK
ncbi:MAG: hypothetical protein KMY55_12500 [Dethiosulfatibacter sp.]|nr:hypothetical protein [Dethiosulfatibacter sp.]